MGNPEIMVALYCAGADADAPDLSGATALHCAVRDARLETVRHGLRRWGSPWEIQELQGRK